MTQTAAGSVGAAEDELAVELAASTRRVLEAAGGTDVARAASERGGQDGAAVTEVFSALSRLELGSLLLEDSGAGMTAVAAVCAELGRVASPAPVAASLFAAVGALVAAGADSAGETWSGRLERVVAGELLVGPALLEPGRPAAGSPTTQASGGLLDGAKALVPGGAAATAFLVPASDEHGVGLYWVESQPGVAVEPAVSVDGSRTLGSLTMQSARGERLPLEGDHVGLATSLSHLWTVALIADAVGACGRAFELADAYARSRQQFGVPVGTFQAVQHLLVDAFVDLSLTRAALETCVLRLDGGDDEADRSVRVAAALAVEALPRVARSAVQVFAGIGYTWEHDVSLLYKRVLSFTSLLGGVEEQRALLATEVFGAPATPG